MIKYSRYINNDGHGTVVYEWHGKDTNEGQKEEEERREKERENEIKT